MVQLDPSKPFHARVIERMHGDEVGWLLTTNRSGAAVPSLVWFLWDRADSVLIYSKPAPKLRNIEQQPLVGFNLNSDADGTNMVIFTGTARRAPEQPAIKDNPVYLEKYRPVMDRAGYVVERFSDEYSVAIVVTLDQVRGF